jgi:hypothetical protein
VITARTIDDILVQSAGVRRLNLAERSNYALGTGAVVAQKY